ncbi:MAG: hypothetical protein WKG07_34015 [Hymenobacter sp.]
MTAGCRSRASTTLGLGRALHARHRQQRPRRNPQAERHPGGRLRQGHYIYTGLSLFRELPAGVPGAYRLLTNMVSLGK